MIPKIDLELYRLLLLSNYNSKNSGLKRENQVMYLTGQALLYIFYTIFILYTSALTLSMEICICKYNFGTHNFINLNYIHNLSTNPVGDTNVKLLYGVLFVMIVLRYLSVSCNVRGKPVKSPLSYVFGKFKKRCCWYFCCISLWYFLLNFILITIVNPSLLNPGPKQF